MNRIIKSEVKKILVISMQGIGDLLLATPSLALLRRNFPKAHIAILILKRTENIILGNPNVDKVFTYDHKALNSFIEAGNA